jgi:hypothetical protein
MLLRFELPQRRDRIDRYRDDLDIKLAEVESISRELTQLFGARAGEGQGEKASSTLRFPRKSDSVNVVPAVDFAVKSGARSPACVVFCSSVEVIREN